MCVFAFGSFSVSQFVTFITAVSNKKRAFEEQALRKILKSLKCLIGLILNSHLSGLCSIWYKVICYAATFSSQFCLNFHAHSSNKA